ncbi:sulfatase [Amycolatopsis xylanica]|uniref:sulfatase n=1 Tax=Amycolatopsis xylanica TaxID=589385 RepID=UPI001FE1C74B|nr:sulfatase [Amycolatopsis xylanica]
MLAGLLVLVVLTAPTHLDQLTPAAFLRVPIEGLIGVVVLLALPDRARRVAAVAGGIALGLLAVVKILDIGFDAVLFRPFDLVLDWPLFGPGVEYVDVTSGRTAAIGLVVLALVLVAGLVVASTWSVLRLSRAVVRRRPVVLRSVAVLAVVSFTLTVPGVPIMSTNAANLVSAHARQVNAGLRDRSEFAAEAAVDAFRDTPARDLLTALRGKDVIVSFVESYGRVALEHPEMAWQVGQVLDEGTTTLRSLGYSSRSAFLTSPVSGGGSWMAQATFLSGLKVDNQQRYQTLVASDRLTLNRAFQRADWRSVGVMPGITRAWPEGQFFGYDRIYAADDLGYRGPRFSYATMPDQYTLSAFQRDEHTGRHAPVMATIPLVSSHLPWTPLPHLIGWDQVGDGSVYAPMTTGDDPHDAIYSRDPAVVRADYRKSIEYSLGSLISYVKTYGDNNLVLVFLGDHQPNAMVTGENAGRDVPITIVARDPSVLDRISGWGWTDGLKPAPGAPVWPMNAFRDRFLTAFSPPAPSPPPAH